MKPQAGKDQGNDGYYELRLAGKKGEGNFALKRISTGTKILVDKPLMVIPDGGSDANKTFIAEQQYHSLQGDNRRIFDLLPAIKDFGVKKFDANAFDKFKSNSFSATGSRSGCYAFASQFNHSCLPNCAWTTNRLDEFELHVIRDVEMGEELTFAYAEDYLYLPTDERLYLAANSFASGSICHCDMCTASGVTQSSSDLRRRILRGLMHAWDERDIAPGYDRKSSHTDQTSGSIFTSGASDLYGKNYDEKEMALEPLRMFINLAEQEGIVGSQQLLYAYGELLRRVVDDARINIRAIDLDKFERLTNRAEKLNINSGGMGYAPGTGAGRDFDRDIQEFRTVIAGARESLGSCAI